jgi:GntR family transcriptional regulator
VILLKPNPSSGVPIYLQLMEQVKHAIETGALKAGEQLPSIRPLAEELVVNPNTVAKAYRELEHQGVIELRQGAGAFVAHNAIAKEDAERLKAAQVLVAQGIERLRARGLTDEEIRRLVEAELAGITEGTRSSFAKATEDKRD